MDPTTDEPDVPDRPIILQCGDCRTVLGDTTLLLAMDAGAGTLTLTAANNITCDRTKPVTSTSGHDVGSTFFPLHCSHCNTVVGKMYFTTPRALDDLRDAFTFDRDSITSFEVGTFTSTASDGSSSPPAGGIKAPQHDSVSVELFRQLAESVKEDFAKVKYTIIALGERIERIDSQQPVSAEQQATHSDSEFEEDENGERNTNTRPTRPNEASSVSPVERKTTTTTSKRVKYDDAGNIIRKRGRPKKSRHSTAVSAAEMQIA